MVVSMRQLTRSVMSAACLLATAAPAWAAPAKPWAVDYQTSVEGTSNLQQQRGGLADLILRNSLEFSYTPLSDADNSALLRVQALNQRYYFNWEYNSTFLIGTALASRRLFDSTFGYVGYQLLYKDANSATLVSQTDQDVFAGAVFYRPLGPTRLLFHGYQVDFLRAAVTSTSYQGHSLYVTYRDVTTERWTNSLSYRSQWRIFDADPAEAWRNLEWRNFLIGESSYRLTDWWSLRAEAIYLHNIAAREDLGFGAWNFGLFTRFSY